MKSVKILNAAGGSPKVAVAEHPEPAPPKDSEVLVRMLCVGLDGTDREIVTEKYGQPPEGEADLILGHEALGVVERCGDRAGLQPGDLVAVVVRRPCREPRCVNCRNGRSDYCQTGAFTERGIKGAHGFLTEFVKDEERYFVKLPPRARSFGVLTEPQSIVEKVWDEIQRIQQRLIWQPRTALVLGSGPLGMLAAITCRCLGLDVRVWSLSPADGPDARWLEAIGAHYREADSSAGAFADYVGTLPDKPDVIWECTGYSPLAFEAMEALAPNGVLALLGVSPGERRHELDTNRLNMELVLKNKCVVGSVNAARSHFETAVHRLLQMEQRFPGALPRMISERFTLEQVPSIDFERITLKAVVDLIPPDRWDEWIRREDEEIAYSFSV
jgi:threonine dehydrogenase-like Zn-dependent dehydrogenase